MQRNFTESRKSWQNLTGCVAESIRETRECSIGINGDIAGTLDSNYWKGPGARAGTEREVVAVPIQEPITMQVRCGKEGGGKGALLQKDLSATLDTKNMQTLFQPTQNRIINLNKDDVQSKAIISPEGIAPSLYAGECRGGGGECYVIDKKNKYCIPIQDQAISNGSGHGLGIGNEDDPMYSLMSETQHGICVIEGNGSRPSHRGDGYKESDIMYTLNATEQHAVCYQNVVGTLNACDYKWPQNQQLDEDKFIVEEKNTYQKTTGPLMANSHPGSYSGQDAYNDMLVATEYIVRRLTPLECSRLQGLPDWWTDGIEIPNPTEEDLQFWREVFETHREIVTHAKKPKTDKQIIKWLKEPDTDGAKYKMYGNGIALPCFLYVMEGIKEVLDREEQPQ